jgi:hypothetical protein
MAVTHLLFSAHQRCQASKGFPYMPSGSHRCPIHSWASMRVVGIYGAFGSDHRDFDPGPNPSRSIRTPSASARTLHRLRLPAGRPFGLPDVPAGHAGRKFFKLLRFDIGIVCVVRRQPC